MARFAGKVGFITTRKTHLDVYEEVPVERTYYGDLLRNTRRMQNSGTLNDNLVISNEVSIVADPFVKENFHNIRYVVYMGTKWKVDSVDVQFPRLVLSLGEVYNA